MNYLGMYHAVWSNFIPQNHHLFHNILHHSWCPAAAFIPHSQNYAVKWDIAHLSFNSYSVNHAEKWDFVFSNVVNFSWWLSVQSRIQNLWPPSSLSTPPPPPPPPLCLDMLHEFTIVRLSPPPTVLSCPSSPPLVLQVGMLSAPQLSLCFALGSDAGASRLHTLRFLASGKKKKKKKGGGKQIFWVMRSRPGALPFEETRRKSRFFPSQQPLQRGGTRKEQRAHSSRRLQTGVSILLAAQRGSFTTVTMCAAM